MASIAAEISDSVVKGSQAETHSPLFHGSQLLMNEGSALEAAANGNAVVGVQDRPYIVGLVSLQGTGQQGQMVVTMFSSIQADPRMASKPSRSISQRAISCS